MKKFFTMLLIFFSVLISGSYAATQSELLVKHTTVHTTVVGAKWWHSKEVPCPAEGCGKNHNSIASGGDGLLDGSHHNGCRHGWGREDLEKINKDLDLPEYTYYPEGNPPKLPEGWIKVGERTKTEDRFCGNRGIISTTRETKRTCTLTYWIIEEVDCEHEVRCIKHNLLQSQHGSGGTGEARYFEWDGEYANGKTCDKCGRTLYTGRCIINCQHTEVCELHGKNKEWHTESSGYIWTGRKVSEESCPKCGSRLKVGVCEKREKDNNDDKGTECNHSIVCERHSLFEDEHPYKDKNGDTYKWTGTQNTTKCKKCGAQLKKGICAKIKPTTKKDNETISEPEPTKPHEHTWVDVEHDCIQAPDENPIITAKDRKFEAEANIVKVPYYVEDTFDLSGKVHVHSDDPKQTEEESPRVCTFDLKHICTVCGLNEKIGGMCSKVIPYKMRSATADFNDKYYGAYATFEGFRVENDVNSIRLKEGRTDEYNASRQKDFTDIDFGKTVKISSLYTPELRKDKDTGLSYGWVRIRCDCGVEIKSYKIFFDFREPSQKTYTLTVKVSDKSNGGLVKVDAGEYGKNSSKGKIREGSSVDIYAKESEGYKFVGWFDENGAKYSEKRIRDDNGELKSSIIMPGYDLTLTAMFIAKENEKYDVRVYSDGNGTVSFEGKYDDNQSGMSIFTKVVGGDDISIIASPRNGYKVMSWEVLEWNGNEKTWQVLEREKEMITLSDIRRDYIIYVSFEPTYDGKFSELIVSRIGPGMVIGGTKYAIPGEFYPIQAIPNEGANFEVWREEPDGIETSYKSLDFVKMPDRERYHLKAVFTEKDECYKVIVKSDGNGDVSIENGNPVPEDIIIVKAGTEITINGYPDEDFKFENWTDENENLISTEPELTVKIDEDKVYIAHFEYVGVGKYNNLRVESAGGGKVTGNVNRAIEGKKYPIEAIPNEGYEFLYWLDKDEEIITDYTRYDFITMPGRDVTLVAHFREQDKDKYRLTLEVEGEGSVEGAGDYSPETNVRIKATTGEGYEFAGWYEGNKLISKHLDTQIIMPYHDLTLRAVFRKYGSTDNDLSFKILSIRDVRWKDYFTSKGTNLNNELSIPNNAVKNTVLVDDAELVDKSYDKNRNIVYGYAVEFEWVTRDVTKRNSKLVSEGKYRAGSEVDLRVVPSLYVKTSSGDFRKLDSVELDSYGTIDSGNEESREQFTITGDEEIVLSESGKALPQVTWRWVWYLPLDKYERIREEVGTDSKVVIGFDIGLFNTRGDRIYSYVEAINSMKKSDWGGKVFTYRTDKNLLTDIYDNANN